MIDAKPCCVWVVEFTYGVVGGSRKKLYITEPNMSGADVAQIVLGSHPNTFFTLYNVDAGILTIPEKMGSGDILYQPDNTRITQDGDVIVPVTEDEPGFDDTGAQIIVFKPPSLTGELG